MSDKSENNVSRLLGDYELESMLKQAGLPDRAPEAARQEVYKATRGAWQQSLAGYEQPDRRRWLAVAAAVFLAVAITLIVPSLQQTANIEASYSVAKISGNPQISHGDTGWQNLSSGESLATATRIRTGTQQRVAIAISPGGSLRIDQDSGLEILADGNIRLDHGGIYIDTSGGIAAISIQTPRGIVRHLGTQYSVRTEQGDVEVLVREGEVTIESGPEKHYLQAGAGLGISSEGQVRERAVSSYSQDWQWTQQISPEFEIDGSSALDFLLWVARESGYSLEFDKPAVKRMAGEIRLSGSMGPISPLESLQAVIAGTRLEYQIKEGVILIK